MRRIWHKFLAWWPWQNKSETKRLVNENDKLLEDLAESRDKHGHLVTQYRLMVSENNRLHNLLARAKRERKENRK